MATLVVINEQHQLMLDQIRSLNETFGEGKWSRLDVPADGWNAEEQLAKLQEVGNTTLVFASPLPLMLRDASVRQDAKTLVFHNDKREKKELPNGKIIFTVAKDGWVIL